MSPANQEQAIRDGLFMADDFIAIEKPISDFDESLIDEYFRRLTTIDMRHIDPRYEQKVLRTKRFFMDTVTAWIIVSFDTIASRTDSQLHLGSGKEIEGRMAVRVMKEADRMLMLAVSLRGLEDDETQDFQKISEQYFLDSWGSAGIQAVQIWAYQQISERLEKGMRLTNMWEPGQTRFPIENQSLMFDKLKLGEYGCNLKSSMAIEPQKTKTCILGIVPEDTQDLPIPCSFCRFGKTCPLSRIREFPKSA